MMKAAIAALALVATASTVPVPALAQQLKPEDQVHLRQSTMALIGYNFGTLAAMAQGKRPFEKAEAERAAAILPHLAALPGRFFGEGTSDVPNVKTKAKPEIWMNMDDFKKKLEHMQHEVAMLPQAVASGDMGAFKKQVGETGKACKSCHEDYKFK
jgi:cytochrome c556